MRTKDFVEALKEQGFNFASGVPCTMLAGVIKRLPERIPYIPATREDEAIGMAVGAWLGGKKPLVLMQNSGLGNCINALTSLVMPCRVPLLLIISWRGATKKDAPEHWVMGQKMPNLLDALGIRWSVLDDDYEGVLDSREGISALVVKKGAFT